MKQASIKGYNLLQSRTLIIVTTLFFYVSITQSQGCPRVQGLGNPVNIFHSYINSLMKFASPSSDEKITVTMVNEQNIDSLIYRYIFKVTTGNNRVYFIGILSQITQENIKNQSFAHNIVRFIQSADIRDAQRLLGIYDASKDDEVNCGNLKETLAHYCEQNGFSFSGDIKMNQQRPQKGSGEISNSNLLTFLGKGSSSLLSGSSSQANANSAINFSSSDLANSNLSGMISQLGKNGQLSDFQNSLLQSLLGGNANAQGQGNLGSLLNSMSQSQKQTSSSTIQIKPFTLTAQPLPQTQYTLGTVLSGTGRDKIFQRGNRNGNEGGIEQVTEGKSELVHPTALLGAVDPKLLSLINQMTTQNSVSFNGRTLQAKPLKKKQQHRRRQNRKQHCGRHSRIRHWYHSHH